MEVGLKSAKFYQPAYNSKSPARGLLQQRVMSEGVLVPRCMYLFTDQYWCLGVRFVLLGVGRAGLVGARRDEQQTASER